LLVEGGAWKSKPRFFASVSKAVVSWEKIPPGLNETLWNLLENTVIGKIPFYSTTWKLSASGKRMNGWTHWECREPARFAAAERLKKTPERAQTKT